MKDPKPAAKRLLTASIDPELDDFIREEATTTGKSISSVANKYLRVGIGLKGLDLTQPIKVSKLHSSRA